MSIFVNYLLILASFFISSDLLCSDLYTWPQMNENNANSTFIEDTWSLNNHGDYLKQVNKLLKPRKNEWQLDTDRLLSAPSSLDFKNFGNESIFWSLSGERGSGGGGDALYCSNEKRLYSLDYVLTAESMITESLKGLRCNSIIEKVYMRLVDKHPLLSVGLREFMSGLQDSFARGQYEDKQRYYHFFMSRSPLVEVKDEMLGNKSGSLCKDENDYKLYQAAVRLPLADKVFISFDADIFNVLKSDPLQCSFLILHEWVRDFIFESQDNRNLVSFLHSKDFHEKDELGLLSGVAEKVRGHFSKEQGGYQFEDYVSFLNLHGDIATSFHNYDHTLTKFTGSYVNSMDGCRQEVSLVGPAQFKVTYKNNQKRKNCRLSSEHDYYLNCKGLRCVSDHRAPKMPGCKKTTIQLVLGGMFNLYDMKVYCDDQPIGERTWYKEEYENSMKRSLEYWQKRVDQ